MNPIEHDRSVSLPYRSARGRVVLAAVAAAAATVALVVLFCTASRAFAVERHYDSQITGFSFPFAVTIDSAEDVWVADGNEIYEYDSYPSTQRIGTQNGANCSFGSTESLAVDSFSGDLWTTAPCAKENEDEEIDVFGPNGTSAFQLKDHFGSEGAHLAADDSGGSRDGDVYVTSNTPGTVTALTAVGHKADFSASASYIPKNSETGLDENKITGTPAGPFSSGYLHGIAVDGEGNIYVAESKKNEVDEFHSSGEFVRAFTGAGASAGFSAYYVAIDPIDGDILIAGSSGETVDEFSPTGAYAGQVTGANPPGVPGGANLDIHGIAVSPEGYLYVGTGFHPGVVDIFTPTFFLPKISYRPASALTATSVALNATIDPHGGGEVTSCYFEYGASVSYGSAQIPCEPATPYSTPTEVKAPISGLVTGTTYHYRVLATDANGTKKGLDRTIGPPSVESQPAVQIARACAMLKAKVNPDGIDTTVVFEYGPTNAYGFDATPVDVGSSNESQEPSVEVCGLTHGAVYHFRARASNTAAPAGVAGPDRAFRTLPIASITGVSATNTSETAVLGADINPLGLDTSYHFEYLTAAEYTEDGGSFSGVAIPTKVPFPMEAELGSGSEPVLARQYLLGLQPETTYYYRVLANNTSGVLEGPVRTFTTQAPPAPPSCPAATEASTGFRSYLPDCRAYELINPAYLDGYAPEAASLSQDGERFLLNSLGGFAGAESNFAEAPGSDDYESVRTPGGWQTRAINPPGSVLSWGRLEDESPDFSRTVWFGHTPSESNAAVNLYIREPAGSLRLVGPIVPPSALNGIPPLNNILPLTIETGQIKYLGSSKDLSHLFFQSSTFPEEAKKFWPGDKTLPGLGGTDASLYEYSGAGSYEPTLVGVKNVGSVKEAATTGHRAHINEAAELISQCGIELGAGVAISSGIDKYNAVSASGETVFFTAKPEGCMNSAHEEGAGPEVPELYARLHESETVDVSEPSIADCLSCQTAFPRQAVFQGASADGSRVFFLTEQELLPGNPGENLYEYDFDAPAGEKVTAVSHLPSGEAALVQGVARVSEDGSHVYFVAQAVLTEQPNALGYEAQVGRDNLYVYDTETRQTAFIATLVSGTCRTGYGGVSELPCSGDATDWANVDERPVQATPDGRFLLFQSSADLTPDDTSTVTQVFEYDAGTGELVRVSVGHRDPGGYACPVTGHTEQGYGCDGNTENPAYAASVHSPRDQATDSATQEDEALSLSSDGSTVLFNSGDLLVPGADEDCSNAYEYRSQPGAIAQGNVSLVSDPHQVLSNGGIGSCSASAVMDASARDVVVGVADDPLVPQATNTSLDFYDAREDGGFPTPAVLGCEGEVCQGPLGAPLVFGAPASTVLTGSGNLAAPVIAPALKQKTTTKCSKGKRPDHGRCVEKSRSKKKQRKKKQRKRSHERVVHKRGGKR